MNNSYSIDRIYQDISARLDFIPGISNSASSYCTLISYVIIFQFVLLNIVFNVLVIIKILLLQICLRHCSCNVIFHLLVRNNIGTANIYFG